jgi:hypothetical protein
MNSTVEVELCSTEASVEPVEPAVPEEPEPVEPELDEVPSLAALRLSLAAVRSAFA